MVTSIVFLLAANDLDFVSLKYNDSHHRNAYLAQAGVFLQCRLLYFALVPGGLTPSGLCRMQRDANMVDIDNGMRDTVTKRRSMSEGDRMGRHSHQNLCGVRQRPTLLSPRMSSEFVLSVSSGIYLLCTFTLQMF